jgi:hypothetical protein
LESLQAKQEKESYDISNVFYRREYDSYDSLYSLYKTYKENKINEE